MDSDQLYNYSVNGLRLLYSSEDTALPLVSGSGIGSLKASKGDSPNSPFSSRLDSDNLTTLSSSQEQDSYADKVSVACASNSSSLEGNGYFHWPSPGVDHRPENSMLSATRSSFLHSVDGTQHVMHALPGLETTLMVPDGEEEVSTRNNSSGDNQRQPAPNSRSRGFSQQQRELHLSQSQQSFLINRQPIEEMSMWDSPQNNLKQLLIACARALSENCIDEFEYLVQKARDSVSVSGEPIQRLGAYMIEGLVARKEASGTNIYRALRCREPASKDLLSYMHILYEICPYLKFGYMAANGAIAEACRNEDFIHIIDFQIAQGSQWVTLLQALAARPGGPPHVRITGVDDPMSQYARGDGLDAVGRRMKLISEKFNIPVEFHGVPVFGQDVTREMLDVKPGEALAVNFPLQLHHIPDESVEVNNPRDGLLRMVKSLSPKVTTLVEQESNTNTTPFLTRFIETLEFYLAMFGSIDVTLARNNKERINVEQHCLAKDIVNIIACEGKDRVERHELFGKWKSRLIMAGFRQCPLSSYVNSVIESLLKCYSEHYSLKEKDGAMILGWKNRDLISASAWH